MLFGQIVCTNEDTLTFKMDFLLLIIPSLIVIIIYYCKKKITKNTNKKTKKRPLIKTPNVKISNIYTINIQMSNTQNVSNVPKIQKKSNRLSQSTPLIHLVPV